MKMMLAWYPVKDLKAASKFYGETLGLKKLYEMPGWAEFGESTDLPTIGLSETQPGAGGTVVLATDNVDATRASLESKGVKFLGETREIPGIVRLAAFSDPAGNTLQIAQTLLKK